MRVVGGQEPRLWIGNLLLCAINLVVIDPKLGPDVLLERRDLSWITNKWRIRLTPI